MPVRSACRNAESATHRIGCLTDTHSSATLPRQVITDLCPWISENATGKNICGLIHTGDFWTGGNGFTAEHAALIKNLGLPIAVTIGNHDFTDWTTRSTAAFDGMFPLASMTGLQATYSGSGTNSWHRMRVGAEDWGVLMLEFGPTDAQLAWASSVFAANPDLPFIVATHACVSGVNGRLYDWATYGEAQPNNPHHYFDPLGVACNDGQEMWVKSLRDAGNVGIVLSGHDPLVCAFLEIERSAGAMFEWCRFIQRDRQWIDAAYGGDPYVGLLGINRRDNLLSFQAVSPAALLNSRWVEAGLQVPLVV